MTSAAPPASAQPPKKPSSWRFWLAVCLVLAVVPVAYRFVLAPAPAAAPETTATPTAAAPSARAEVSRALSLGQVEGEVEVKRPGGEWRRAEAGTAVGEDAMVRTGPGSFAVLAGAESYEVRLEASTEIAVEELTDSISRLMLGNGMATARVEGAAGKHLFEVRAQGSDATARTRAGAFSISNNGKGTVAVGARAGEVEFLGAGKVVIVRAGQQSVLRPGGAGPSDPTPIPASLLLKVAWPKTREINQRKLVLVGEAAAGSVVRVAGKPVEVDERGQFRAQLPLMEGKNSVTVEAESVGGARATDSRQLKVDTHVEQTRIDKNLWER